MLEALSYISVIVASLAAIYSVLDWRHSFFYKKKIEFAEDILCKFYAARDAIEYARNPFARGHEGKTRERAENELTAESNQKDAYYVPVERLQIKENLFNEILSLRYRYMILFSASEEPFSIINIICSRITVASGMLIRSYRKGGPYLNEEREKKRIENNSKYEKIIWKGLQEEDEISELIVKMINEVEMVCKPQIESSQPFLYGAWIKIVKVWERFKTSLLGNSTN